MQLWKATYRDGSGQLVAAVVEARTSDDAMDVIWGETGGGSVIVAAMPLGWKLPSGVQVKRAVTGKTE